MPPISEPIGPETVIDISHESLIRQWKTLHDWTRDEDKSRQIESAIDGERKRWDEAGRDEGALLHGRRLLEAEEWAENHPLKVRPEVRDFIAASRTYRDRDFRKRKLITQVVAALAVASILLLIVCFFQLQAARTARREAENARREAVDTSKKNKSLKEDAEDLANKYKHEYQKTVETRSKELASLAEAQIPLLNSEGALLLAVEAISLPRKDNFPILEQVETTFMQTLMSRPLVAPVARKSASSGNRIAAMACSPDGRWLVTGNDGPAARLWDLKAGIERTEPILLEGHGNPVSMVGIGPEGRRIVTLDGGGVVRLWNRKPDARIQGILAGTLERVSKSHAHRALEGRGSPRSHVQRRLGLGVELERDRSRAQADPAPASLRSGRLSIILQSRRQVVRRRGTGVALALGHGRSGSGRLGPVDRHQALALLLRTGLQSRQSSARDRG